MSAAAVSLPPPCVPSWQSLALATPPLIFGRVRRPIPRGALGNLRGNVKPTMTSEQLASARGALKQILAAQPFGKGAEEMTPDKAKRATGFRLLGDEVHYEIERHPTSGWLGWTEQTRAVSLRDGAERVVAERVARTVTWETIVRSALANRKKRRPVEEILGRAAARGLQHARACIQCGEFDWQNRAAVVDAAAFGWVADLARYGDVRAAWLGTVDHFRPSLRQEDGDIAEDVCARARDLWCELLWTVLT